MKKQRNDPDTLAEYDFRRGVRGKYAKRYAAGSNVVVIEPGLIEYFPDPESVNDALRGIAAIIERRRSAGSKASRRPVPAR